MEKRKFFTDEDNRAYKYQQDRGNPWKGTFNKWNKRKRERERYDYADEDPEEPEDWGFETYPISRYVASKRGGIIDKVVDYPFNKIFNTAAAQPFVQDQLVNTPIILGDMGSMVQSINLIQQGMAISQRIGNKITMSKLEVRLQLVADYPAQVTNIVGGQARYLIVYDRQTNGAYPTNSSSFVGGIMSTIDQTGAITYSGTGATRVMYAMLDVNSLDRFIVLYDRFITIPPYDNNGLTANSFVGPTDNNTFNHIFDLDLKDLETVYSGNVLNGSESLTIADIMTGGLYIVGVGPHYTETGDLPPFCLAGNIRLWFHDN